MNDTFLSALLSALDLVVFMRQSNGLFRQVTASPAWLVQAAGTASPPEGVRLAQTFPFLESFLGDAELAWRDERPEPFRSETFTASADQGDVLLRAIAVTAFQWPVLVLERLSGFLDPSAVLQAAREGALDRERQTRVIESLRVPAESLRSAVAELEQADLPSRHGQVVETLKGVSKRLDAALRGELPAGPQPRPR